MKNKENSRMQQLLKLMNLSSEAFVVNKPTVVNEDKINKELARIKNLGTEDVNANFKENYNSGSYVGNGKTVNSIVNNLSNFENLGLYKGVGNRAASLKEDEALEVSIKRALKSGQPVNDIGFYDEVNWNLSSLGFPTKSPVDIKNMTLQLIEK